ncbi:carbon storage regulator [Azotobacter bryophylli]|uniref:Carbon storage regulator n=1 Tax=Azotobacter bryophylli TaxID=1986537 RepID=A0ABV7AVB7_9GAMM
MQTILRHSGESLRINDDVLITVVGISGSQVKLGLEAPAHVALYRQEVYPFRDSRRKPGSGPRRPIGSAKAH